MTRYAKKISVPSLIPRAAQITFDIYRPTADDNDIDDDGDESIFVCICSVTPHRSVPTCMYTSDVTVFMYCTRLKRNFVMLSILVVSHLCQKLIFMSDNKQI